MHHRKQENIYFLVVSIIKITKFSINKFYLRESNQSWKNMKKAIFSSSWYPVLYFYWRRTRAYLGGRRGGDTFYALLLYPLIISRSRSSSRNIRSRSSSGAQLVCTTAAKYKILWMVTGLRLIWKTCPRKKARKGNISRLRSCYSFFKYLLWKYIVICRFSKNSYCKLLSFTTLTSKPLQSHCIACLEHPGQKC